MPRVPVRPYGPFMADQSPLLSTWRLKAAAAGGLCLAAVGIAGVALGDRVPPLDSWIVGHPYSRPETTPAMIATVISGVGTMVGLALLLATASGLLWRLESPQLLAGSSPSSPASRCRASR
jgi:hypothetical protein